VEAISLLSRSLEAVLVNFRKIEKRASHRGNRNPTGYCPFGFVDAAFVDYQSLPSPSNRAGQFNGKLLLARHQAPKSCGTPVAEKGTSPTRENACQPPSA
jgi:hypothetical protein